MSGLSRSSKIIAVKEMFIITAFKTKLCRKSGQFFRPTPMPLPRTRIIPSHPARPRVDIPGRMRLKDTEIESEKKRYIKGERSGGERIRKREIERDREREIE